jgi:DNA-binding cell septation regulator SpoVG
MKIAIIGTSPIMLIRALILSSQHNVKIFDPSKIIGGAWGMMKLEKKLNIPRQTNAIVPTSLKEEKKIIKINKFLKKNFYIKIKKFDNFQFKQNYKPKNIFSYDLSSLYQKVKKEIPIINKKINKILIKNDDFYLRKEKFDQVFISYFNSINHIEYNKKKILIDYQLFKSKHVGCLLKKKMSKKLVYNEFTDKVFDRYLINGKKNYFVGRISREYKDKNFKNLMNDTNINFLNKKNISKKVFFYYKNFKRNEQQIKTLVEIKNKNLKIIDTKQFATSLTKLFNIYE